MRARWLGVCVLCAGCSGVPSGSSSDEASVDVKVNETVQQVPAKRVEDKAGRIEVIVHHPGRNERNIYLTFKKFDTGYENDRGEAVSEALIDALREAVQKDLLESDGILGCRSVVDGRQDGRQIRVRFEHGGHNYALMSASNCVDLAPFNVIVDGKRFVQLSGAIGEALYALLGEDARYTNQLEHNKAGFIDFTQRLDAELDVTPAEAQRSLVSQFESILLQDASVSGVMSTRKVDAEGESMLPRMEIGCNQTQNEDCKKLVGRYTVPLSGGVSFSFAFSLESGRVEAVVPKSFEGVKQALVQPAIKAFIEHEGQSVSVSWKSPESCPLVGALAPWFKAEDVPKSCETWTFSNADKSKSVVYYVQLDATWISANRESLESSLEPLMKNKKLPKVTRKFYSTVMDGKDVGRKWNVFLDGKSWIYVFEEKDGKSTCVTCENR